jgi:hypothetical protein
MLPIFAIIRISLIALFQRLRRVSSGFPGAIADRASDEVGTRYSQSEADRAEIGVNPLV